MASAFSHAFVAVALGKTWTGARMAWRFWVLSAVCAVVPDADVLGFAFGVRYGDVLGHRGLTHSLAFAFVLAVVVVCSRSGSGARARAGGGRSSCISSS